MPLLLTTTGGKRSGAILMRDISNWQTPMISQRPRARFAIELTSIEFVATDDP